MKLNDAPLLARFRNFISGIKSDDKTCIVYHADSDGVSSAVIIAKLIKTQTQNGINHMYYWDNISRLGGLLNEIKLNMPDKLIFLDISADQLKGIKRFEQHSDILIIDHHKLYRDVNSIKTILIKPQMIDPKARPEGYCCSKLCYDLGNELADMNDLDWVAAIGILGDSCYDHWKLFVDHTLQKYGLSNRPDIYKTKLGQSAELIFYSIAHDIKNAMLCYDLLYSSKSPNSRQISSKLSRYKKEIEDEISYWDSNVKKLAEKYPNLDLIIDLIKPRYFINPAIIKNVSLKNPHKTIIIAQDMNLDTLNISARRADNRIALNELLEKSVKNLEGANAGGHINAAGATIKKRDFFKFKENIFRILSSRHPAC